jgi:hypothetical protein
MTTIVRHPRAYSFHSSLHTVQLLARTFDQPLSRPPAIRLARVALLEILQGDPVPAGSLGTAINAIQSDLSLLARSRRREHAVAARIDRALANAQLLINEMPDESMPRRW